MILDVCLGTRTSWKILYVLAEAPGKAITRKEIQDISRVGNKVLTKFLLLLEKFGIISSQKIGKRNHYKMNMDSPITEKIISIIHEEKKCLNNPNLKKFMMIRDFIYELTNVDLDFIESAIMFGSFAKRTSTDSSDIDIALIIDKNNPKYELIVADTIDKLKNRYKTEIQAHYLLKKEYDVQKSKLSQEIKKDGIKLI